MGNRRILILVVAMVTAVVRWMSQGQAIAYENIVVTDGGTLIGTVTLSGIVPGPKGYNLTPTSPAMPREFATTVSP